MIKAGFIILTSLVTLNMAYRIVGTLAWLCECLGLPFFVGAFGEFLDDLYFTDAMIFPHLLSTASFLLLAMFIPSLYRNYLSKRTMIMFGLGVLVPALRYFSFLFMASDIGTIIGLSLVAVLKLTYIIVLLVFVADDLETYNFD